MLESSKSAFVRQLFPPENVQDNKRPPTSASQFKVRKHTQAHAHMHKHTTLAILLSLCFLLSQSFSLCALLLTSSFSRLFLFLTCFFYFSRTDSDHCTCGHADVLHPALHTLHPTQPNQGMCVRALVCVSFSYVCVRACARVCGFIRLFHRLGNY